MNKCALFYVEQTVTVHIALFYVRAQMFLQISCSLVVEFQWDLCTMKAHKQAKKRIQKTYNKETGKFHGCSLYQLWLKMAGGFAQLFQGAVERAFGHNLEGVWVFSLFSKRGFIFFEQRNHSLTESRRKNSRGVSIYLEMTIRISAVLWSVVSDQFGFK